MQRGSMGFQPKMLDAIKESTLRYLKAYVYRDRSVIRSIIDGIPDSASAFESAQAMRRDSTRYLLLHEIGHLELNSFDPSKEAVALGYFRPLSAFFYSRATGVEVGADCLAFAESINMKFHDAILSGRDFRQADEVDRALRSAILANGYFFAVVDILFHLAEARGDSHAANRLSQARKRKNVVRRQLKWYVSGDLSARYNRKLWKWSYSSHWRIQDRFVSHVLKDVIPLV
jgi:hypothetical protein